MRVALVNPPWSLEGSTDPGCHEPHLPLKLGYARALLAARGHQALLFDAHLEGASLGSVCDAVVWSEPDLVVLTTAPSFTGADGRLGPELPQLVVSTLGERLGRAHEVDGASAAAGRGRSSRSGRPALVAVGPCGGTAPGEVLRQLGVEAVVAGEFEEAIVELADTPRGKWQRLEGLVTREQATPRGGPRRVDPSRLPALRWEQALLRHHRHHHQRLDALGEGPGAELEASRIDPSSGAARWRPLPQLLEELDGLRASGVRYVYFVDEPLGPSPPLLEALARRELKFGVQLRIEQWSAKDLELLGRAGCISIQLLGSGRDRGLPWQPGGPSKSAMAGGRGADRQDRADAPDRREPAAVAPAQEAGGQG